MNTIEIQKRYNNLAEDTCCLSCGGAINYAKAKENEFCADLGSGRGTDVLRMAEAVGNKGYAYGIDVSDEMLKKARKNARKLGINNAKFIKSNLEEIDLPSGKLDLIISNCTLNHVENKQKTWNEIFRIIKHKGRFIVSDIYATETVPDKFRNDPTAVAECWAGSITKPEYLDILNIAGFKKIEILEESKPYEKGEIKVVSFTIKGIKN